MRDPEMVSRAQKAAATLERAWERWRIMHGLSAEPMPPVSSYVGYSIEEPWGRPRVVFGVDAREAELLAALLDRHGCAGPLYQPGPDEVTDRGAKAALATDPLLEEARSRIPAPAQSAEEERWVRDAQRSPAVGAAGGTATGDTAPEPPRRPGRRAPAGDSGRDNNPPGLPYASDADAAPAASDERPARRGERRAEPGRPTRRERRASGRQRPAARQADGHQAARQADGHQAARQADGHQAARQADGHQAAPQSATAQPSATEQGERISGSAAIMRGTTQQSTRRSEKQRPATQTDTGLPAPAQAPEPSVSAARKPLAAPADAPEGDWPEDASPLRAGRAGLDAGAAPGRPADHQEDRLASLPDAADPRRDHAGEAVAEAGWDQAGDTGWEHAGDTSWGNPGEAGWSHPGEGRWSHRGESGRDDAAQNHAAEAGWDDSDADWSPAHGAGQDHPADAARDRAAEAALDRGNDAGWTPAGDAAQDYPEDLAAEQVPHAGWDHGRNGRWSHHHRETGRDIVDDGASDHAAEAGPDHGNEADWRHPGQGHLAEDAPNHPAGAGWDRGTDAEWPPAGDTAGEDAAEADWNRGTDAGWSRAGTARGDYPPDADWDETGEPARDHAAEAGWDRAGEAGPVHEANGGWDRAGEAGPVHGANGDWDHADGNHTSEPGPGHAAAAGYGQVRDIGRDQVSQTGRDIPGETAAGPRGTADREPGDQPRRRDLPSASNHRRRPAPEPDLPEVSGLVGAANGPDRVIASLPAPITPEDVQAGAPRPDGASSGTADRGGRSDTIAAELAGWASGELPGQASARLAAWAAIGGVPAPSYRPASATDIGSPGVGTTEPVR